MDIYFQQKLQQLGHQRTKETLNLQGHKINNKYIILDLIARGSNSLIYYGIEESSRQEMVFKVYNLKQIELATSFYDKEICKRLSSYEIGFMRKCHSMHIMRCLDVYEDKNMKVIVSEYCNMGSLKQEIQRRKQKIINEMRATIILKQIITALKNFHKNCRRMHKNLKSENILIKNGVYKLIDFGLPGSMEQMRREQDCNFRIPQLMLLRSYNEKAEVWNVGVLFYEILFGELPPLLNKSSSLTINNPDSLYSRNDQWISSHTRQFITECLRFNPDYRLTWEELQSHPIFKLITAGPPQRQIPSLSNIHQQMNSLRMASEIMIDEQLSEQLQAWSNRCSQSEQVVAQVWQSQCSDFYRQKRNLQVQRREVQKQMDKSYQKMGGDYELNKLLQASEQYFRQKVNKQQSTYYMSLRQYYNDCLKVQFFLQEIVRPIKALPHYQQDKQIISFLYLLLSRSFTALSIINSFTEKPPHQKFNNLLLEHIKIQTRSLYMIVLKEWEKVSELLTKEQSKWNHMISDFFRKKVSTKEFEQQNRFFCGIQNIDYAKDDQIEFTKHFFFKHVQPLISTHSQERAQKSSMANLDGMRRYLEIYKQIWGIKQNISQSYCYIKDYIQEQLLKEPL